MNKPKSTMIELTLNYFNDVEDVYYERDGRVVRPGEYKVYREGGKIFLEVFHND
jgi:hypothetical protein